MLPVFATGPGLRQAHVRSRAAPTRGVLGPWLRKANDVSSNNRLKRIQMLDLVFTAVRCAMQLSCLRGLRVTIGGFCKRIGLARNACLERHHRHESDEIVCGREEIRIDGCSGV